MKTIALALILSAVVQAAPDGGSVESIKVHGKGLEKNLEGDSPDRDVAVYLPKGYAASGSRRYPVVYMLHGYTDSVAKWFSEPKHWINLPTVIDKSIASGASREMIVVMPDAYTRYKGSMYSNSATTGDWEDFIARELVAYVDSHYRTLAKVESRGLTGHSMGGYGTMRIGMKHPEVFSSIYLLSPCCMAPVASGAGNQASMASAEAIKSPDEVAAANFGTSVTFATAAAWAPNPKNPPFFLDLPFRDGKPRPEIVAKFTANAPLAMVDQYIANLKRLHAIGFDAGNEDKGIAATNVTLDELLTSYGIPHTYEVYDGTHISRVPERIETKMLPFFSRNLSFGP